MDLGRFLTSNQPRVSWRQPDAWKHVSAVALLALFPAGAFAQETRTELLEQQRVERARGQPPPSSPPLERWLLYVEGRFLQQRAVPAAGAFYPRVGGVVPDSGLGAGAGYRRSFANDTIRIDAGALLTNC